MGYCNICAQVLLLPDDRDSDTTQLFVAIFVNCFSSRVYGELEFWLSTIKVTTIVIISKFI